MCFMYFILYFIFFAVPFKFRVVGFRARMDEPKNVLSSSHMGL